MPRRPRARSAYVGEMLELQRLIMIQGRKNIFLPRARHPWEGPPGSLTDPDAPAHPGTTTKKVQS